MLTEPRAFSGPRRPAWIRSSTAPTLTMPAIAEMKKNGTYLVPTLYLADWFLANAERLHVPPEMIAKGREVMPAARKNIAHAFASGVKVAFGTDAAVYPHGLNAHEFAVMVKLGLTPLQSIQSATINAADLLGWSDKIGRGGSGQVGGHHRRRWRSAAGCDHARASEVRDEERRSGEERIRKVITGAPPSSRSLREGGIPQSFSAGDFYNS